MAALSADRNTVSKGADFILTAPVKASTTIYAGSMVCIDSTGYAVPADDAAGYTFFGVAVAQADNSSGAAGDIDVECYRYGAFEFAASAIAAGDLDDIAYCTDDQTVDDTAPANAVKVGRIVEVISATSVMVDISAATGSVA